MIRFNERIVLACDQIGVESEKDLHSVLADDELYQRLRDKLNPVDQSKEDLPRLLPETPVTENVQKRDMKRVIISSSVQVVSITIIFHFVIFLDIIGEKEGMYTGIIMSFVVVVIIFAASIFFDRLCLFILG